ncbi:MAG: MarR family transcriptional regulator [Cyanobacteria bacterium REEB67]|nr:MarR family transcriptional regulator [Cyanobacteria bacterium REEB67]
MTFAKISSDGDCSHFPEPINAAQSGQSARFTPAQVADKIMECAPVIMHFIRSKLKERPDTHVSVAQIRVLGFIYKHPGCSLTYLSEFLGIASPSASTMIDRLVKSGMVIREVDPTRRRNLILHLTEAGEQELTGARRLAIDELSKQFAALSAEQLEQIDRSMTVLKDLLSTVYENFDDESESPSKFPVEQKKLLKQGRSKTKINASNADKIFKLQAVRELNDRSDNNGGKVDTSSKNTRGPI